jgi:outer membrane protein
MLKRILFFLLLALACFGTTFGQQFTRFAVVDLPRVFTEFRRESRAVREFEERSTRVQNEIDRMTREIQNLRSRHADAIQQDNQSEIIRLETEINRRTENLRNFYQARTAELDRERQNLMQSDSFLNQVNNEIRLLAESEGITTVFDISKTPGIIWYSPAFDFTDRLIQRLRASSSR